MARHVAKATKGRAGKGAAPEQDDAKGARLARRLEGIMIAARKSGLLGEKSSRISGRVSPALIMQAKKRTGLASDTELIEFALANIALEDGFPEAFKNARGTVDPDVKLGF